MKIASLSDLQRAQHLNGWLSRPEVDEIILSIDLERHEKIRLQSRLETLFNDCGCFWGPPAFLLCFVGFFITQYTAVGFSWVLVGFSFLIAVASAAAAKLLALYVSHRQLRKELDLLAERMPLVQET